MLSVWRKFNIHFRTIARLVLVLVCIPFSTANNSGAFAQHHDSFYGVIRNHFHNILSTAPGTTARISPLSTVQQPTTTVDTDAPYLPAGYVYVQYSNRKSDAVCARASMTVGIPVNTCVVTDTLSYKVQIATDNCLGAAVFYYNDANCTTVQRNQSLSAFEDRCSAFEDRCSAYDGERVVTVGDTSVTVPLYFWQLKCTAQPTKPIPVTSAVVEFYSDSVSCRKAVGYSTMAGDLCLPVQDGLYSTALRCSASGTANLNEYVGGTCSSVVSETTPYSPSTCTATSSLASATTSAVLSQLHHRESALAHTHSHTMHLVAQTAKIIQPQQQPVLGLEGAADKVTAFKVSCAQKNTDYSAIISVVQILDDVAYSTFLRDQADSTLALQHTIAAALNSSHAVRDQGGVRLGDVYITQVTEHVEEAPADPSDPKDGNVSGSEEDCAGDKDGGKGDNKSEDESSDESNGSWSGEGKNPGSDSGKGSDTDCESSSSESHGRNSSSPTARPTRRPTSPTAAPTRRPSAPSAPSTVPSRRPTAPSALPTRRPTTPTAAPSVRVTSRVRSSSAPSVPVTPRPSAPTVAPTRKSSFPTALPRNGSWSEEGANGQSGSRSEEDPGSGAGSDSDEASGDKDSHEGSAEDKGSWKNGSDTDCESEAASSSSEGHGGRNSSSPTARPTRRPTSPSAAPTRRPSAPSAPSAVPSRRPTAPSVMPTRKPTSPTASPTRKSSAPTAFSAAPTRRPISVGTSSPTVAATKIKDGSGGSSPTPGRTAALATARNILAAPYAQYTPNSPFSPNSPNSPWFTPIGNNNNNNAEEESDELSVSYTVVSYQPGLTNDLLASALSAAVKNGTFDRLLKKWAVVVGARGLTRASSSNLDVNALATDGPGGGTGGGDPPGGGSGSGGAPSTSQDPAHWFTMKHVLVSVGAVAVGVVLCLLLRALYFKVFPGSDAVLPQLAKPLGAKKNKKDKSLMLKSDEENYDGMEEEEVEVELTEVLGYAVAV